MAEMLGRCHDAQVLLSEELAEAKNSAVPSRPSRWEENQALLAESKEQVEEALEAANVAAAGAAVAQQAAVDAAVAIASEEHKKALAAMKEAENEALAAATVAAAGEATAAAEEQAAAGSSCFCFRVLGGVQEGEVIETCRTGSKN